MRAMTERSPSPGTDSGTPPPLSQDVQPPVDRYCDVVMKGGVVDGVVYPWAIMELAHHYRFKNLGGTSVGALAAALTAAAEYSRRYGSVAGFNKVMLDIPNQLAADAEGQPGRTKLFSLFQAGPQTQRLFDVFVALFSAPASHSQPQRWLTGLTALLKAYAPWALLGVLTGTALALLLGWAMDLPAGCCDLTAWPKGAFAAICLCFALAGLLILVALGVWRDVVHGLIPGGMGLCTGKQTSTAPDAPQGLIDWLHEGIQAAAGRTLDQALTFKDLWEAPGGPVTPSSSTHTQRTHAIDLRMVSSNLTQGRPYGFPLTGTNNRLFFKKEELDAYFPTEVMNCLMAKAHVYTPVLSTSAKKPLEEIYYELPQGDLPIIIATRLSLSVPILFKAVPLWALKPNPGPDEHPFYCCWFSDGGICANFPIHQFDAALPRWPTFGIMLDKARAGQAVWVTDHHDDGLQEDGDLPAINTSPSRQLFHFACTLLNTVRSWNDNTSVRLPGVRDRVVHIGLEPEHSSQDAKDSVLGGLNLKITGAAILRMAGVYGRPAGQALVKKFLGPPLSASTATAWREHRWVRFNSFATALRTRMAGFTAAAQHAEHTDPLSAQIADSRITPPLTGTVAHKALTKTQADALVNVQQALSALEASFAVAHPVQPYKPDPQSELHMRSPL